jgi:hypothetical protein
MAYPDKPIAAVCAAVHDRSRSREGRSSYRRWAAAEPSLEQWPDVHALAVAAARRPPAEQDRVLTVLLPFAQNDEFAQLTVVAVLARALGSVVSGWAAAGVVGAELSEMEAELLAGCWEATVTLARRLGVGGQMPARPGLWLIDRARDSVRGPRRRQRRAGRRLLPLDVAAGRVAVGPDRSSAEVLAGEISRAVRTGRLSGREATPVFLTRVAGFAVSEAAARLGCTDAVVRTMRARAEKRLIVGAAA